MKSWPSLRRRNGKNIIDLYFSIPKNEFSQKQEIWRPRNFYFFSTSKQDNFLVQFLVGASDYGPHEAQTLFSSKFAYANSFLSPANTYL